MKPSCGHVIKSVRIAKARMGRPVPEPDPKLIARGRRNSRSRNRKRSRSRDPFCAKNDFSQSTTYSVSQNESAKRARGSFNCKHSGAESENAVTSTLCVRPSLSNTGRSFEQGGSKRVKSRKLPPIIEDGLPWTEEEMENFENLFGEKLFDNTIDTGPACQADLSQLSTRRFRSYGPEASGLTGNRSKGDLGQTFERARKLLEQFGNLSVSNSQLLRLLSYFSSEKGFFDFLALEGEVLINYFEKTKLYPRRKVYK